MAFSRNLVAAIAVTLLAASPTAYAQGRGGGHGGGGRGAGAGRAAVRSMPAGRVATPRSSVSVGSRPRGGAVVVGTAGPRVFGAPRVFAGQRVFAAPNVASRRVFAAPRVAVGVGFGHAAVRVAPVRFYRPYYAFRPRFSLGFGLWSGFPIAYPYSYGYYNPYYYAPYYDPYGYPYSATPYPTYPVTAYPPSAYPQSAYPPAAASMGGVSFDISPGNAEVFVDGQDMGTVSEFTATSQPLGLTVGRHHVQISAPGFRTLEFDVDVVTGEVVPYQGTLQR